MTNGVYHHHHYITSSSNNKNDALSLCHTKKETKIMSIFITTIIIIIIKRLALCVCTSIFIFPHSITSLCMMYINEKFKNKKKFNIEMIKMIYEPFAQYDDDVVVVVNDRKKTTIKT